MLHKIQYGGGPTLSHEDCCLDCLIDGARNVVSADTYRHQRESFKQLARDILDGKNEDGKYYVSRSWYDCKSFLLSFLFLQKGIRGDGAKHSIFYCSGNCFYFKLYGTSIMYDLREKEKMQRIFLDQTNNILKHHKCLKRVNFYSTVD